HADPLGEGHAILPFSVRRLGWVWCALGDFEPLTFRFIGRGSDEPVPRLSKHFGCNPTIWRAHRADRITTPEDSCLASGPKSSGVRWPRPHAARRVACHSVRSHAVPVALGGEPPSRSWKSSRASRVTGGRRIAQ